MKPADSFFNQLDPEMQTLARQLRQIIQEASPELEEAVKWGMPTYSCKGNVCYIGVKTNYINLGFYRGSELSSDNLTIEGTGKNLRHIKVRSSENLNNQAIAELVKEAVKLQVN